MKFSVLIPVFNGEEHLEAAVRGLQAQTFPDWEVVIVDDGSTDATAAVAVRLTADDPRVRLVRQPNGGVSVARNRALDEARGDWIVWLDADDGYVPDALARLAALTEAHPDCACFQFPYFELDPRSGARRPVVPPAYADFGGTVWPGLTAFDLLFARRTTFGQNWQPWRFVYRRDVRPRFRPGVIHEDVDVLPLHLARLDKVYLAREPLYLYRPARAGAATQFFTPRRVRDILDVMAHVHGELAAGALPPDLACGFAGALAFNLFGYLLAVPTFAEPDRSELLAAFAAHPAWLTAIHWPPKTAWLKRLLLRVLGVKGAARLISRLTHGKGFHKLTPKR